MTTTATMRRITYDPSNIFSGLSCVCGSMLIPQIGLHHRFRYAGISGTRLPNVSQQSTRPRRCDLRKAREFKDEYTESRTLHRMTERRTNASPTLALGPPMRLLQINALWAGACEQSQFTPLPMPIRIGKTSLPQPCQLGFNVAATALEIL